MFGKLKNYIKMCRVSENFFKNYVARRIYLKIFIPIHSDTIQFILMKESQNIYSFIYIHSHVLHNNVLVNNGPHIEGWSIKL